MKIALIAPLEECVPPKKYGGTELVVYNLAEQLIKLGHKVTLFATGESAGNADLKAVFPYPLRSFTSSFDDKCRESLRYLCIGKICHHLQQEKFDIIHNHLGWKFLFFQAAVKSPMLTTLHGPLDRAYEQIVLDYYRNSNFISISLNQRRPMPHLNYISNVYNGIEIGKFKFFPESQDYLAFLGRMSPLKGPIQAIEIAKKTHSRLIMAAKVDVVDKEFFEKKVAPLIDGKQIIFKGEVDHFEKVKLLGNAKALLAPIQWEEPFGLYFIEAMICGTPVISLDRGSVPEIIVHGKTGFICANEKEAAEKIKLVGAINRKECHNYVKNRFSAEKMAQEYISAYRKILAKES